MEKEDDRIWTAEEIEEHEHDEWLKLQERGEEAYKEVEDEFRRRNEKEEEEDVYEDPYEKEERKPVAVYLQYRSKFQVGR